MTSPIAFGQGSIAALVPRYTNSVLYPQALLNMPAIDKGKIETIKKRMVNGTVNVKAGGLASTTMLSDGGTLPSGSQVTPVQLTYQAKVIFSRISIPRGSAKLVATKQDGIDLVFEEMESCGRDCGRILGRGVFSSSLGSPATSVTADSSTSFEVADPSGWRAGMSFDVYNSTTYIETCRVTDVAIPANPASNTTITFTGGGTGGAADNSWTTSYDLYLQGAYDNAITSLADVSAASSLYGKSIASDEWSGNLVSSVGDLSIEDLQNMSTRVKRRRGRTYDCVISNSLNEQRYTALMIQNRRFMNTKMDATGGMAVTFDGREWFVDENVNDQSIFFHTKEDVKLHEFVPFEPDTDGGKADVQLNRGAVLVDGDTYSYDVQISGLYNTRVTRRNGSGHMSGVTG